MITTFYPPYSFGGDGVFVHRLSNELAARGHHVEVIHCIDSYRLLAGGGPSKAYSDHPNVTVHGLKSPLGFLSPLATQQTGYPLFKARRVRAILEEGFDVIHYHNISLVGGPKILEYGRSVKLYTMHEYWLVCPTHVLFRFRRAPCENRRCLLCSLAYGRPPQWWRYLNLLGAAVDHVDAFVAPSAFSKDRHREMGLDVPIVQLPYFAPEVKADLPASERAVYAAGGEPYFLFVGRLERLKGLHTLIPVFRDHRRARLLIAGTGSYGPPMQRQAADTTNVQFLGHLPSERLDALYREAVALIVPSICLDVFPLVTLEAFRQRTPVIVTNLGGLPEIVRESDGGLVYESEEELIAAMDRLLLDPAYRNELGRRGHQTFLRKWTPDAHLERYFALIGHIDEDRHGSPLASRHGGDYGARS